MVGFFFGNRKMCYGAKLCSWVSTHILGCLAPALPLGGEGNPQVPAGEPRGTGQKRGRGSSVWASRAIYP